VGGNPKNVFTFVKNLTFLGGVKAADAVQQAGFTGPVGSDNGEDFTTEKSGIDIIKRLDPAEGQGQILNFYDNIIVQSDPRITFVSFLDHRIFFPSQEYVYIKNEHMNVKLSKG